MASSSIRSISVPAMANSLPSPGRNQRLFAVPLKPNSNFRPLHSFRVSQHPATKSSSPTTSQDDQENEQLGMSIDALQRFISVNLGNWNGSFLQFDPDGKLLQRVRTRLAVNSYGEDELISLIQTLYIRQPTSSTSIYGDDNEAEWAEYKIKETNMFTVDKYQQIGFFPEEKAFALRYQTAGMLETVLREGVLGEDDTGEEFPRNLMLPSRRPSIVCENCLHSLDKDMRARAFHIMDPRGVLEMLLVFFEEKSGEVPIFPPIHDLMDDVDRITPFLGKWKGHSITKRSGIYGATIAEAESVTSLEHDGKGHVTQEVVSTVDGGNVTTTVNWTGNASGNMVTFEGGFRMTLLPGGMYVGYPCDVAKNVAELKSFHLEFCWLELPCKRQRLVRTYDHEGMVVSSTYFMETKL